MTSFPKLFSILIISLVISLGTAFTTWADEAQSILSDLPMTFVPNAGQVNADIDYYMRGMGGVIYFTPTTVSLTLPSDSEGQAYQQLQLHHLNANEEPELSGWDQLRGTVNYFSGSDSSKWLTNIPTYAGIKYQALYPGIDVVYDGVEGVLKGTYYLDRGIDPNIIRWQYDGVQSLSINEETGDLELLISDDNILVERAPVAWQLIDDQKIAVDVSFTIIDDAIGFLVGNYDDSYPLTIDPVLEYSTYIGGSSPDTAWGIATDGNGFAYVVGETWSADFPGLTADSLDNTINSLEAFVIKIDTNTFGANSLVWSTYLNGGGAFGVAVDDDGDVYVTGYSRLTFPVTDNAFQTEHKYIDAFLAKIASDGTELLYSSLLGGTSYDRGSGIAVDSNENAYIGGSTISTAFPTTSSAHNTVYSGNGYDIFVSKIDTNASGTSSLLYSSYLGRGDADAGVAADDDGNVYVSGRTESGSFPTTSNAYQPSLNGIGDAYVARFNTNLSGIASLVYATYFGGSNAENHNSYTGDISTDGEGNAYITGETLSSDLPIVNGFDSTYGGGITDAFVAVFDTNASGMASLLYSTYLGGKDFDQGYGIAATRNGNVYVTGQSRSSNFPKRDAISSFGGSIGSFVTKLDTTLVGDASLIYSTFLGRNGNGYGGSAVDSSGTAYVAGQISATDFPIVGGFQSSYGGETDAYMAKLSFRSDIEITKVVEPEITIVGQPLTVTIEVRGKGPEIATGVILTEVIPASIFDIVSVVSSQGSCELFPSVVYCRMGNLKVGQRESVVIIASPVSTTAGGGAAALFSDLREFPQPLPDSLGLLMRNVRALDDSTPLVATVDGVEEDTNIDDNTVQRDVTVYTFDTYVPVLRSPDDGVNDSDTTPTFSWDAIPGATHYELYLSRFDVTLADPIEVTGTSYIPSDDLLFTSYDWRVRGIDGDDTPTAWSPIRTLTIDASNKQAPLLNLFETDTPVLSWNGVTGATDYEIEVDNINNFTPPLSFSAILPANTLVVTTSSLPNGTYFWRIRAKNGSEFGSWSIVQSFIVDTP